MNRTLHYTLTKTWATDEAGFSQAAAETVACADVMVDTRHHWTFWSDLSRGEARWHLDGAFGRALIKEAVAGGDLELLGQGLHVVQDFYAHNSLDLVPGKVTPLFWAFPLRRVFGRFRSIHCMYPTRAVVLKLPLPRRARSWLMSRAHTDIWEQQTPANRKRLYRSTLDSLQAFAQAWPELVKQEE